MTSTQLMTADELLATGSDAPYELWEGVLREVSPSGFRSGAVGSRLQILVGQFVLERGLGLTTNADAGYVLSEVSQTVVAPDIGFVRANRLADNVPDRGFFPGRPDLAVEVISPTDERADIDRKQSLYARAGVPLVWWVDSERRTVTVHRPGQNPEILDESAMLDGGEILPGFQLKISRIFDLV